MAKGLIWATAEDLARSRVRVLSLYRQILRSLNSPDLPLNYAARLARKAEARSIFVVAAEERSIHNIEDLISTGEDVIFTSDKECVVVWNFGIDISPICGQLSMMKHIYILIHGCFL